MKKCLFAALGFLLAFAKPLLAGGPVQIEWSNSGVLLPELAPFYVDADGTTPLSAGDLLVAGDGAHLELIALQGGTNYILAVGTIGDVGETNGFFQFSTPVPSNILAGAIGSPLAVKFYDAPLATANKFGIVSNLSFTVPNPNWVVPPFPYPFGIEYTPTAYMGPKTLGGILGPGYYTDTIIPEPSTFFLVGLGVVATWFVRKRKR